MKYEHALLLAAAGLAVAGPHRHAHRHAHNNHLEQRAPEAATDVVIIKETKIVYLLDGKEISEAEVQAGFADGTLILGDGGKPERVEPVTSISSVTPTPTPTPSSTSTSSSSSSSLAPSPIVMAEVKPSSKPPPPVENKSFSGSGLTREFENGELSCDEFPSAFGAIPLKGLGFSGWSGIQKPIDMGGCYTDIFTPNFFSNSKCTEGSYCSYACPPGYQKASWPTKQGCTKQSIGGLLCKGGKLHMADGSISKTLCVPGDENVKLRVRNKLSGDGVAICRTDYPGTEAMVIPVWVTPGDTQPICANNQDTYYKWDNQKTSAQWYVQKKGVSVDDGCQWSSLAKENGNFSPTTLGAGYVPGDGISYISLATNKPSTEAVLDYNIEFVSEPASLMNGQCAHIYNPGSKTGQYCSKKDDNGKWSNCNDKGCTIAARKGATIYAVLTDA